MGLDPDVFWNLTWEEYGLLVKAHDKKKDSIIIQREILTRMLNGVPVGMVKAWGRKKSSQIYPLEGEKDQLKEMMDLMNEDIAFKPGIVYVEGRGFIHKSEINANGNAT